LVSLRQNLSSGSGADTHLPQSGDRIVAENLYQHAEHYFRIDNARRESNQQGTPPRSTIPADVEMNSEADSREVDVDRF